MEWSNETIFEFLESFRNEPCLWDPRLRSHKNRSAQSDAWRRLMRSLSFQVTLDELKKKKESLMGYYRIHLNKYKKSLKSGTGDVYRTSWFAFDTMDSFLRPIYITDSIMTTESNSEENITEESMSFKEDIENKSVSEKSPESSSNNDWESTSATNYPKNKKFKQSHIQYKRVQTPPEIIIAEEQTNGGFGGLKETTTKKREELDEYDYFAGMIASKIRKLENMDDREELMNSIQNLTFEFYMKSRRRNSPDRNCPVYMELQPDLSIETKVHSLADDRDVKFAQSRYEQ